MLTNYKIKIGTNFNLSRSVTCIYRGVVMKKVPNNPAKRAALTHLVRRKAVNIEFKDVSYSVSEGRRKGIRRFFLNLTQFVTL